MWDSGPSTPTRGLLPDISISPDDRPSSRQWKGAASPSDASTSAGTPAVYTQRPSSRSGSQTQVRPRELQCSLYSSEVVATAINCVRVSGTREVSLSRKMDDLFGRHGDDHVRLSVRPLSRQTSSPAVPPSRSALETVDVFQWRPSEKPASQQMLAPRRHSITAAPAEVTTEPSQKPAPRRSSFSDALGELLHESQPRFKEAEIREVAARPVPLARQSSEPVMRPASLMSPVRPQQTGIRTGPPSPYNGKVSQLARTTLAKVPQRPRPL